MEITHAAQAPSTEPMTIGEVLHGDDGLLAILAMGAFEGVKPEDIAEGKNPSSKAPEDL